MDEIIVVKDQFYILATSALADDRTRVLKHNDTFAVFDRFGDIQQLGRGVQGLYHRDTRFLSRLALTLGGIRPLLLSSSVKEDNALLAVDLMNPDVSVDGEVVIPRGTLHVFRSTFLWQGVCYEALRIRSYGERTIEISFALDFEADWRDVFEVRGLTRRSQGRLLPEVVEEDGVVLAYEGLDRVVRRTRIRATPRPARVSAGGMSFTASLEPHAEAAFLLTISCEAEEPPVPRPLDVALREAGAARGSLRGEDCQVHTANPQFNEWLERSAADLHMMVTRTAETTYPDAGVPWYGTPFGRDGIITAFEYLWVNPAVARGVLAYLARTQADEVDPARDAEPGKILHETREGEMAVLGEHPFRRYYGSVDATPLFVMLAGAYYERTGDRAFIRELWPAIERALGWIDEYGDQDGDGFVEYARRSLAGLANQGWKDSQDSVFHADGRLAEGPIALAEVQAYVYAARQQAAGLAAVLGRRDQAAALHEQARALRERFERAFWSEELSSYVLALDGRKRPCAVRTSNAGHCLFAGIADPAHGARAAATLLAPDSFSGWGIRTVSANERRYNPMSYHNGSVWPHDNALIAHGLGRYGLRPQAAKLLTGLFDAALFLDQYRLPELFCGFRRRPGEGPTLYPVACSPQSWASAAAFLLLQACLGLSLSGVEGRVYFHRALLPEFLPEVRLSNLRVGDGAVDLVLERHPESVGIDVVRREGAVEIVAVK